MRQKTRTIVLAISLAAILTPALGACSSNPVESIVEGAIEQAGGGDVDLNSDGGLPDGFPVDAVPLYDGEIVGGMGASTADGGGWTVIVKTPDVAETFLSISDQLTSAGFTALFGASEASGTFSSTDYSVLVTVADDGTGPTATYVVGPPVIPQTE
jgi:hypothetical protein